MEELWGIANRTDSDLSIHMQAVKRFQTTLFQSHGKDLFCTSLSLHNLWAVSYWPWLWVGTRKKSCWTETLYFVFACGYRSISIGCTPVIKKVPLMHFVEELYKTLATNSVWIMILVKVLVVDIAVRMKSALHFASRRFRDVG